MLNLQNIDEELLYNVLEIPSFSGMEDLVRKFLIEYANVNGIQVMIDNKHNVYLTKGTPEKKQFYPCLTAHMDTVQERQIPYIERNELLTLETEQKGNGKHIIFSKGFGLGGDDKAGIVIALSVMSKMDVCKAVFFVEEEYGCNGSRVANLTWFKDVGYIIGFDSPEGKCASWSCQGEILFDRHFYETYLEELNSKFGMTKYMAHPYTDVLLLRMDTSLACMNFGAGYYNYHELDEYVIPEEMDSAVAMALYLIKRLGNNEYLIPFYSRYKMKEVDKDIDWFTNKFE